MNCNTLPPRCCLASWSSLSPESGCHDFKSGPKNVDPNKYLKILILFIQVKLNVTCSNIFTKYLYRFATLSVGKILLTEANLCCGPA